MVDKYIEESKVDDYCRSDFLFTVNRGGPKVPQAVGRSLTTDHVAFHFVEQPIGEIVSIG